MRVIIEVRVEDESSSVGRPGPITVAEWHRRDHSVADLGMTLTEGRNLLANVQSALVCQQAASWIAGHAACERCGSALAHKDSRSLMLRTVFGKVAVPSPRFWACVCRAKRDEPRRTVSPLCKALPRRVTSELEYLQTRWAAHLPYRQATQLLCEVLPLDQTISAGSTRRRVLSVGMALDAEVAREIAAQPKTVHHLGVREAAHVGCVSVDSAWLAFSSTPKGREAVRALAELKSPWSLKSKLNQERHVNIVAGRATFAAHAPRLYAYVHKQVPSAAARLDHFLHQCGVGPQERVTVISDDAGEFEKAVQDSALARGRILDWFHIAMKFEAAQRAVWGCKTIDPMDRQWVEGEIRGAKWLVWHGKGSKAVARLKALDDRLLVDPTFECTTLWWNLRGISGYIRNNDRTLVNYGARHRKGLAISSSIAESAVNQVVSLRMAKKQQMRWTDAGAHYLVQVRVADLNGELSAKRLAKLAKPTRATLPNERIAA